MKTIKEHYDEEIAIISACLGHYTEFGYTPELQPIVDALKECKEKLIKAKEELWQSTK